MSENMIIRGILLLTAGLLVQACVPKPGPELFSPLGLVTAARFAEPNYHDVVTVTVIVRAQRGGRKLIRANAIYNHRPIEDPKVYQNFFASLERSLFVTN